MKLNSYKKILIVRLSSLGDILLSTPLIRTLKTTYPELQIDFLLRKEYESTLKFNPHIENLLTIDRNYNRKKLNYSLKSKSYDLIIDLQNNLRSHQFLRGIDSKIVRYKKPYLKRILLVNLKINKYEEITSIPDRYAQAIPNLKLDGKGLELFLPQETHTKLNTKNNIGLCPGSRHFTKMWPKNHFIELGNKLIMKNYNVILLGGKDDKEICDEISKGVKGSQNLANDNNLIELAVNMQLCKSIICNDSGLMHTALAVKVPVVAIFGSTVKEFGFFPYQGKNLVLENNSLSCRPCSHIGLDRCPKGHLNCLNKISPDSVLEAIQNLTN